MTRLDTEPACPGRRTFNITELTISRILVPILDIFIGPYLKKVERLSWLAESSSRKEKKERRNNQVTINTSLSGIDRVLVC